MKPTSSVPDDPERTELFTADPGMFAELVRAHRDQLWAVALRVTGDPEDAADAVQDALIQAFRRKDLFAGEVRAASWLYRLVVRTALDRVHRQSRRATSQLELDEQNMPGAQTSPEIEDLALSLDVEDALNRLTPQHRAAVVLVDMQGHTIAEATRQLTISESTLKRRLHAGRGELRRILAEPSEDATAAASIIALRRSQHIENRSHLDKIRSVLVRFRSTAETPEAIAHPAAVGLSAGLEALFLRLGPPPADLIANGNGGTAGE